MRTVRGRRKVLFMENDEIVTVLGEKDANLLSKYTSVKLGKLFRRINPYKSRIKYPSPYSNPFFNLLRKIVRIPGQLSARMEKFEQYFSIQRNEGYTPQLDDKILTDWNGLMISAFARAGHRHLMTKGIHRTG